MTMVQTLRLSSDLGTVIENSTPITQTVTLTQVSWSTYEALLADMGDHRSTRLTYDQGKLQIKIPFQLHEIINRLLARIVITLTEELDLDVIALGSTTLNRPELAKGVEPDSCFYIQQASQFPGLNPQIPATLPPDLVIEVDITSPSSQRMAVYQQLEVPEIWCYRDKVGLEIYRLADEAGEGYGRSSSSQVFPLLTAEKLNQLIGERQTQTENGVMRSFRSWIQAHCLE
jgi:Uma2 family endonuclease